ncbi:polar amino acid transport system substrate-binding protein [Malonomonas rubra DSM 5091]|uniref:Polar amino acid transport system substrate-binding protein n=1 Tax=Malonomonas rubra DSM 5091 TaxID=1122189 RepID=A0A1M6MQ30_MALRU|nr:transporter substrate-binding domain-containing protein [Malonomonas rubra]SHJ85470.1 polar amino acid transport system substrate-binding protein [Malonomonas rubra DSM 5091]
MLRKQLLLILLLLWIALPATAAEPMKIVYFDSYPPRSWLENGQMKGILVDIITEALHNRLGIPLQHEGYPWARAQAMVESGHADAFITVPTAKRKAYTVVSQEPVISFNLFISTQKNNPHLEELKQVTDIDGLKPYKLVDYHGNGFAAKRLKEFNVEWMPEVTSVYPFLNAGKADVLLVSERGIYDLNRFGYSNKLIVLPQPVYSLEFHLCIGKHSSFTDLLPQADKALREMQSEGLIKQISARYYR